MSQSTLLQELTAAVHAAQQRTYRRYAHTPKPRTTAPCPYCGDAALLQQTLGVVQVDLPEIFLMVDHNIASSMLCYGHMDDTSMRTGNGREEWRFMGIPVILAPDTKGWRVCRGA